MESIDFRRTTLDGLKRLARSIKKETGCKHMAALEQAARQAGFAHYYAARMALDLAPEPLRQPEPKPAWHQRAPATERAAQTIAVTWKRSRLAPE